jgi:hypothetical protein
MNLYWLRVPARKSKLGRGPLVALQGTGYENDNVCGLPHYDRQPHRQPLGFDVAYFAFVRLRIPRTPG